MAKSRNRPSKAQKQTLKIVKGQLRAVKSTASLIKKFTVAPKKKSAWDRKYETYFARARHLGIEKPMTKSNFKTWTAELKARNRDYAPKDVALAQLYGGRSRKQIARDYSTAKRRGFEGELSDFVRMKAWTQVDTAREELILKLQEEGLDKQAIQRIVSVQIYGSE